MKIFWEKGETIALITRPRRFGKTLTFSMVQHFFAKAVDNQPTAALFQDFHIAQNAEFMKKHQGQYPVISVTFKDVKGHSYAATIKKFTALFERLYRQHEHLLVNHDKTCLTEYDKAEFIQYLTGKVDEEKLDLALQFLSEFLYKVHGNKQSIILIDEYDAPLSTAYEHGFLEELSGFMRNMLSSALKDNAYICKGLITGVVRISQSGMLSGLNNLKLSTVLDKEYQSYFGFTEEEVAALVKRKNIDVGLAEIKTFYNGYQIADTILYNPWSIMQFIRSAELKPYWVLTANDMLIKKLLLQSRPEDKEKLEDLIQGKSVHCEINPNLRYDELMSSPSALWTLLLFGGYLTAASQTYNGLDIICQLKIPNEEILQQYTKVFRGWLKEEIGDKKYHTFLKTLVEGKIDAFTDTLNEYMLNTLSVKDVGGDKPQPERFYHGLVLGLISGLQSTHIILSNRESGQGFYDVLLLPKVETAKTQAVILELKHMTKNVSKQDNGKIKEKLKKEADLALKQIEHKQYEDMLKQHPHITSLVKVGLAFNNKTAVSSYSEKAFLPLSKSKNPFTSVRE